MGSLKSLFEIPYFFFNESGIPAWRFMLLAKEYPFWYMVLVYGSRTCTKNVSHIRMVPLTVIQYVYYIIQHPRHCVMRLILCISHQTNTFLGPKFNLPLKHFFFPKVQNEYILFHCNSFPSIFGMVFL